MYSYQVTGFKDIKNTVDSTSKCDPLQLFCTRRTTELYNKADHVTVLFKLCKQFIFMDYNLNVPERFARLVYIQY